MFGTENSDMGLQKKAAKGVVWSVVHKWGTVAISTVTFIILARLLPPEAFGLVALASIFTALIEILVDSGLSSAIVQRHDLEQEHLDTAFWTNIIIGLMLTFVGIALSGAIASFYDEPVLAPILVWFSFNFVIIALSSTQLAILQRKLAFKNLAARSLVASLIGGIVGVTMAFTGFGVWSLVGQDLASSIAAVIVLWTASSWRPSLKFSRRHFKDLFGFGISMVGNKILLFLNRRTDDFLIGYFLGPTLLGYYTIGYRLLLVVIRLVTGITNFVAFPAFSRIQQQPEKMQRAYYKVTQYTSMLAIPAFIGMAILAPELVDTFFGKKWAPSIPVMQVLALIGIIQCLMIIDGSVMKASGKPSWYFGIMLLTSVCSVIGFLIAIRWGIVAVAASFVIVGYLVAPISVATVRKLIQIDIGVYLRQFVAPLFASLTMIAVLVVLKQLLKDLELNKYFEIAVYVAAGLGAYLLAIGLMARNLFWQGIELVRLALPDWKLFRIIKFPIIATKEELRK